MNTTLFHSVFVGVALLVIVALPAQAAVVNGGFEAGTFAGWNTIGDTSIQTSSIGISPLPKVASGAPDDVKRQPLFLEQCGWY